MRFLRVPIEACSKMRGVGSLPRTKPEGPAWLMRRPRALDNELYGHRRHAPLAAGGVRERMGRNARAIQEIKARLNLVDIARRYVDLKRNGPRWVAPCPFHQETKPSFSINEEEGFLLFRLSGFRRFVRFLRAINGLDFKETLEQLAEEGWRHAGTRAAEARRPACRTNHVQTAAAAENP